MAYKLSFSSANNGKRIEPKPVTFLNFFFFQFVNPKSIIVGLTAISMFIDADTFLRDSVILTVIFFFMAVGSQTAWCLMGNTCEYLCFVEFGYTRYSYWRSFACISNLAKALNYWRWSLEQNTKFLV